jgi:lysine-N-methylase
MIDGDFELSANLSCPHAARLALKDKDGMTFARDAVSMKKMPTLDSSPVKPSEDIGALHYFHAVREYAIGLLQNREYSLDDRLVLLGLLNRRFSDALAENPGADLAAIQFEFEKQMAGGVSAALLAKMKPDPFTQTKLTKELIDQQIMYQKGTPRYKQLIGESLYGLGSFTDSTMRDVADGYAAAYREYYAPFTKENGHMLENFLVNEYFRQRMPFGKFKGIWDSYVFLCVLYAITRMHLVGMSGFHKGLDEEKVALLASALSREIMHNAKFIDSLIELLERSNAISLAHMVMLVKPPPSVQLIQTPSLT